ncbi:hypothetical protein Bca101_049587 [Brassica carinata]
MAESKPEQPWMVYLSTFVAVCGSCWVLMQTGYSSPAQAAIRNDLFRTIVEFSLFGSLLTFGAMIGAITSGPIADLVGRKGSSGSGSRQTGNGLWNGSILLCGEPIEGRCQSLFFAGGATAEHLAADIGDLVLINCYLKLDEGNRPLEVSALRENKKIVETPPIDNKV